MTSRTRYFVIASLLVLVVGLGTGLVAYYVGLPGGLSIGREGPDELRYVPRDAVIVAYADVAEIMASQVRQRIRRVMPIPEDGQRQFQEQTGIDIESDIDHIVTFVRPEPAASGGGLVLARGRFSDVKIEALMREQGAVVEEYKGKRVLARLNLAGPDGDSFALSFLEPGLVAVGNAQSIRTIIDLPTSGDDVTKNPELMDLLRPLDRGHAWAIGRFDALMARSARLPPQIASQIPAVTVFSVSGRVDSDIRGVLRADARDEEAANNLRDVVRGFLALAKLQAGARPEFQTMLQSLELGGTGKSVALSFSIPGEVFEALHTTPFEGAAPKGSSQ